MCSLATKLVVRMLIPLPFRSFIDTFILLGCPSTQHPPVTSPCRNTRKAYLALAHRTHRTARGSVSGSKLS